MTPTLSQLCKALNSGKTVYIAERTEVWQCSRCGLFYATKELAEDCEWLCDVDPE